MSTQLRELEDSLQVRLFDRSGRRLVLTDAGRRALAYADDIFATGQELVGALQGGEQTPERLVIGITDVIPKLVAYRLIAPALSLPRPVRAICQEGPTAKLLVDLSIHSLDVVLSDTPIPPGVRVRAFNHLLGECGVALMATAEVAKRYRRGFPASLDGAPFLLPQQGTSLRQGLDRWFSNHGIRPSITGEFADSALLKVFGQSGAGVFAVPTVIEREVRRQHRAHRIGLADGIVERYYAISVQRKIHHPAVATICDTARARLFR